MRNWIIGLVVLGIIGSIAYFVLGQGGSATTQEEQTPVADILPPVTASERVVAEAEVVPIRDVELRFETSGTVAEIPVAEGDLVDRGDMLARLDTRDLQLQVEETAAQLAQSRADYERLLAGATTDQVQAAQAQVVNADARVANAQAQVASAQARLEEAQARVAAAQATVAQAQGNLQSVQGAVTAEDIAAAQADLNEAQAALADLEAGADALEIAEARNRVQQAQVQLQNTRDQLSHNKTQAELTLQQQTEALQNAQIAYSEAYWDWQYVRDHDRPPPQTEGEQSPPLSDQSEQSYRYRLNEAENALRRAEQELESARKSVEETRLAEITGIQDAEEDVQAAQIALEQVLEPAEEAELAAARARVARAEASLASLQGEERAGNIASAAAQVENNRANVGAAAADAAASQAALESALADVAAAQAEVERQQANLQDLTAEPIQPDKDEREARILQSEVQLRQAQLDLENATLTAPIPGTVVEVDLEVGERVDTTQVVIRIADFSEWEIETTDLTELGIVQIDAGDPVTITFDALPELELPGRVKSIQEIGKNRQGDIVYKVTITPEAWDRRLRWGMTATVAIEPQD